MSFRDTEQQRPRAVRLSNLQYGQLKAIQRAPGHTIYLDKLSGFLQGTLGSFKAAGRQYVVETKARNGIVLTDAGHDAIHQFEHADFLRKMSSMEFSSLLDLNPKARQPVLLRRRGGRKVA